MCLVLHCSVVADVLRYAFTEQTFQQFSSLCQLLVYLNIRYILSAAQNLRGPTPLILLKNMSTMFWWEMGRVFVLLFHWPAGYSSIWHLEELHNVFYHEKTSVKCTLKESTLCTYSCFPQWDAEAGAKTIQRKLVPQITSLGLIAHICQNLMIKFKIFVFAVESFWLSLSPNTYWSLPQTEQSKSNPLWTQLKEHYALSAGVCPSRTLNTRCRSASAAGAVGGCVRGEKDGALVLCVRSNRDSGRQSGDCGGWVHHQGHVLRRTVSRAVTLHRHRRATWSLTEQWQTGSSLRCYFFYNFTQNLSLRYRNRNENFSFFIYFSKLFNVLKRF